MSDNDAREDDFWSAQWAEVLGMGAAVITAADAVMDAMRGDLGPAFKGKTAAEAAPEVRRRIENWTKARNRLIAYAKAAQSDLSAAAEPEGPSPLSPEGSYPEAEIESREGQDG